MVATRWLERSRREEKKGRREGWWRVARGVYIVGDMKTRKKTGKRG